MPALAGLLEFALRDFNAEPGSEPEPFLAVAYRFAGSAAEVDKGELTLGEVMQKRPIAVVYRFLTQLLHGAHPCLLAPLL